MGGYTLMGANPHNPGGRGLGEITRSELEGRVLDGERREREALVAFRDLSRRFREQTAELATAEAALVEMTREREERNEFWLDMVGGIKVLIEAHLDPVLSVASGAVRVSDRDRLRQVLSELTDLPGIASEWKSENHVLNNRLDAAEAQVSEQAQVIEGLREALRQAEAVLAETFKVLLTVKGTLDHPYPDAPTLTPWIRWCERLSRRAYDTRLIARAALASLPPKETTPDE